MPRRESNHDDLVRHIDGSNGRDYHRLEQLLHDIRIRTSEGSRLDDGSKGGDGEASEEMETASVDGGQEEERIECALNGVMPTRAFAFSQQHVLSHPPSRENRTDSTILRKHVHNTQPHVHTPHLVGFKV